MTIDKTALLPEGLEAAVPAEILRRYETMIDDQGIRWPEFAPDSGTDLSHLRWMLVQMYEGMPLDKASRWLGFIQGCLIMRGLTTVTAERDFTRPYLAVQNARPAAQALYGPYGWLNGHRALSEDSWELENDPLENSEEYFSIPLYALVDPFVGAEHARPTAGEPVAWQVEHGGGATFWNVRENAERNAEATNGIVRPLYTSPPSAQGEPVAADVAERLNKLVAWLEGRAMFNEAKDVRVSIRAILSPAPSLAGSDALPRWLELVNTIEVGPDPDEALGLLRAALTAAIGARHE